MEQQTIDKIKQAVITILLGAIASLIPFYFQTSAMTTANEKINTEQSSFIEQTRIRVHEMEIKSAIDDTEINQIKNSLERIEKKIDRLIEKNTVP